MKAICANCGGVLMRPEDWGDSLPGAFRLLWQEQGILCELDEDREGPPVGACVDRGVRLSPERLAARRASVESLWAGEPKTARAQYRWAYDPCAEPPEEAA